MEERNIIAEGSKRKVDSDDELFSYGNTVEFSFKKQKMAQATCGNAKNYASDSGSSEGSSSDCDKSSVSSESSDDDSDHCSEAELGSFDVDKDTIDQPPKCPAQSPTPVICVNNKRTTRSFQALTNLLSHNNKPNIETASPTLPLPTRSNEKLPQLVILDDSPVNRERVIKVKCHGNVNKYKIRQNQDFKLIIDMIAAKERTSSEKVLLYLKESLIKDDDTPKSIEYTVADIIDCVIVVEDALDSGSKHLDNVIKIKVQGDEVHSKQEHTINKFSPLENTIKDYCAARKIDVKTVQIYFDGELVSFKNTPNDLNMEDDDIIDLKCN